MSTNKSSLVKFSSKKKRKNLKHFFDLRNNQKNQIGLILFSAFVISTSLFYLFEERFNEDQWRHKYASRYKMADNIIDSELFINKTQDEVLNKLGEPDEYNPEGNAYFIYYLGIKPSFFKSKHTQLKLTFENNRVIKVIEEPQ